MTLSNDSLTSIGIGTPDNSPITDYRAYMPMDQYRSLHEKYEKAVLALKFYATEFPAPIGTRARITLSELSGNKPSI